MPDTCSDTCTVLIVEDFLPDQELYRRSLRSDSSYAYRFLEAETAEGALELCQTQQVDAILLDYSLPDADGLMFLEVLYQRFNGGSPPVVVITGQGDEMVAARAFKLGAEDYLVKSRLTPDMLRLAVRSAIENARLRLQLQQCDNRFRVSIENMLDCFGICSAIRNEAGRIVDFRIDYLNAAAMQSNQSTAADIGRRLCEMYPAHRETGLFDAYCRVVETGEPLTREELIYSDVFGKQFLTRAFDIHASKLDDGLVLSWRDVTARKQAELERQQQYERERIVHQITQQIRQSLQLDEVLNTAVTEVREYLSADRAFLYRFNPDFSGRIVVESVSEGLPPVIGAEVQDTCFIETHGADYRQGRIQAVADIYTAGLTDCHAEMLARFQIRANLVVPILQGEHLWGLLVLSQCVCPRSWQPSEVDLVRQLAAQIGIAIQQAELYQQVQESQQRLALSLESSQQGIWDYDIAADRAYWSPRCKRLFGLEPDHAPVSMEQFLNCIHPDDRDRIAAAVQALYETNRDYDVEYRIKLAAGSYRWVRSRAFPRRNEQGEIVQWYGTTEDIDDRKQIEFEREELLKREQAARAEAEAANCSKDDFVSLVAHELRSPLNAILGWAKLLQSRQLDAATTVKALETIARNTQAQAQLVEDLLDVSRIVRGALQLTIESVDLVKVIEEAIETVRPTAAAKRLTLESQLDRVPAFSGDPNRLRQVVLNLLTNAVKFTPAGGRIEVVLEQAHAEVCIQISDTGKGIKSDFLPYVFERFRQDQQNATAKQGLGLGLAIVKHLIEGHGGTVTVESPGEGLGTTFTVRLPQTEPSRTVQGEASALAQLPDEPVTISTRYS